MTQKIVRDRRDRDARGFLLDSHDWDPGTFDTFAAEAARVAENSG